MKNRLRIITAVVLCAMIPFSSLCMTAHAAQETPVGMITAVPGAVTSDNVASDPAYQVYRSFLEENSEVVRTVYEGIFSLQSQIDVSGFHLPVGDIPILMDVIKYSFPELFYMNGYRYSYRSGKALNISPEYIVDDPQEKRRLFFEAAEKRYLPLIDDSMDDFTKAVILHDELALSSYYAATDAQGNRSDNYTYMAEGWGVCQDYTECYAYLLARCGIKSEIVSSDAMNHAWIKVELDGSFYNVDLTWDDPTPDRTGKVRHLYFLYSDRVFQTADGELKRKSHYGYRSINPSLNDKYDSFVNLHSFSTQLCYLDDAFYAITEDGRFVRYNHHTDEITVLENLRFTWPAGQNSYWVGNYSGLVSFAKKLYYNGPDAVYRYDPEKGETELFAESTGDQPIYGLRIVNNQLWAVYADNPNTGRVEPVYLIDLPVPYYSVTVDDSITGGTVTADKHTAAEGQTVTLTVAPDNNADIVAVTVNGQEIVPSDGVYSFVMPASDVTVSAIFEQHEALLLGDVDGDLEVTIIDATTIQRVLAELPTRAYNEALADCDGDQEVTILDATVIQRWLAGVDQNERIGKPLTT